MTENFNYRVQKFDSNGVFLAAWGWDVISGNGQTGFEICGPADTCKAGASGGGDARLLKERTTFHAASSLRCCRRADDGCPSLGFRLSQTLARTGKVVFDSDGPGLFEQGSPGRPVKR